MTHCAARRVRCGFRHCLRAVRDGEAEMNGPVRLIHYDAHPVSYMNAVRLLLMLEGDLCHAGTELVRVLDRCGWGI